MVERAAQYLGQTSVIRSVVYISGMRSYITCFVLLLSLNAQSQSFSLLPFGGIGSSAIRTDNYLKENKHPRTSWEGGVDVQYRFSKHFSIVSGVQWVSTAYRVGDLVFENQFDPKTGTVISAPVHFDYRFQYLRVPLLVRYDYELSKKFAIGLQGGVAGSWLLTTKATSSDPTIALATQGNYNSFNLWALANVHVMYKFNEHFGISLAPSFGYILTSSKAEYPQQFQTLGLRVGVAIIL